MEVCAALRRIARLGLNVILVLHQPRYCPLAVRAGCLGRASSSLLLHPRRYEIFTRFDDVLLLGKGGRTVYLGPTEQARNGARDGHAVVVCDVVVVAGGCGCACDFVCQVRE